MGLNIFSRSCGSNPDPALPNPNPTRFRILKVASFRRHVACRVHYPDCTTYGGEKILVDRLTDAWLFCQKELDPHFLENEFSPIARFPATDEGWEDALVYAQQKDDQSPKDSPPP
jgi:hypothetical protein